MHHINPDNDLYQRTLKVFEDKSGPFTSFDRVTTNEAVAIADTVSSECPMIARHAAMNGTVTAVYCDEEIAVVLDEFPGGETAVGIGAQSLDGYGRALLMVGAIDDDPGCSQPEGSDSSDLT
jgi:hypothetical protein